MKYYDDILYEFVSVTQVEILIMSAVFDLTMNLTELDEIVQGQAECNILGTSRREYIPWKNGNTYPFTEWTSAVERNRAGFG